MRIFEIHKKGETLFTTSYDKLYHLTDANGLSYSVEHNKLASLRYGYVSTTYDVNLNGFVGGNHHFFKMILDGKKLASTYGVFDYDFHTQYTDGKFASLDEREIGINTPVIEPLFDFLKGVVFIFSRGLFSREAIIWLIRGHTQRSGFLDAATAKAKPAIRTIAKLYKMQIPIWNKKEGNSLNHNEQELLRDIWNCFRQHKSESETIEFIAEKYEIVDFFGDKLPADTVKRERYREKLEEIFNGYFSGRKYTDVDPNKVKQIVTKCIGMLGYGHGVVNNVIGIAEKHDMFHPVIPAVEWSIIFRDLIKGELDDLDETMMELSARNKYQRQRFNNPSDEYDRMGTHYGTGF